MTMWQQYHTGTRQPCPAAQCRDRNRPWKHQGGDRRFARLSHRQPISLLPSAPVARRAPLVLHTRAAAFPDLRILRVAINWSMTGNMRGHQATQWMSVRLALVLAPLLGVSASTSALPTDFSDIDVPGFTEPASSRPLGESPATSAPEVDPAAPSPHPVKREAMRGNPLWSVPLAALSETNERPILFGLAAAAAATRDFSIGAESAADAAEPTAGRATACAGRNCRRQRSEFRNFCRRDEQGHATSEARRRLSGLATSLGASPRGDDGAR